MGDPAGISAEITIKAWLSRHIESIPPFIFFGSEELLTRRANLINCQIKTKKIDKIENAMIEGIFKEFCLLYTSPSPRDRG